MNRTVQVVNYFNSVALPSRSEFKLVSFVHRAASFPISKNFAVETNDPVVSIRSKPA
jgi:hypothetical protein